MLRLDGSTEASKKILVALEGLFFNEQAFLLPGKHLTFVCGKRIDRPDEPSIRGDFLNYLKEKHQDGGLLPILAELAIDEFLASGEHGAPDLGKFEKLIAECVDSILIFPESPGSFAELGFFAADPDIRGKTLIANEDAFQGNSFINLGIVPFFNADSCFKPMMVLGGNKEEGFKQIVDRLQIRNTTKKYRKRFPSSSFKELVPRHQLIALYELIRALGGVTESTLFDVIHGVFKNYDLERIHRLLALLVAMNYIDRNEHGDYRIRASAPALLEYNPIDSFERVKALVLLFMKKHGPEAEIGKVVS